MERLSHLQQELLQLLKENANEQDIEHIKNYIARYFAKKHTSFPDQWEDKNSHLETIRQWLNEDNVRYEL